MDRTGRNGVVLNRMQYPSALYRYLSFARRPVFPPQKGAVMKKDILTIAVLVILAALLLPVILKVVGAVVGLAFGAVVAIGALLFAGFIVVLVFSGVGLLIPVILGVVGVVLLAVALPVLAPLFFVVLLIVILVKLVS